MSKTVTKTERAYVIEREGQFFVGLGERLVPDDMSFGPNLIDAMRMSDDEYGYPQLLKRGLLPNVRVLPVTVTTTIQLEEEPR